MIGVTTGTITPAIPWRADECLPSARVKVVPPRRWPAAMACPTAMNIIVMTARRAEIALTEVLADSIATITAVIVVLIEESTLTRPNRWPLVRVSSLRIFTACRCQSCSTSPSRKE